MADAECGVLLMRLLGNLAVYALLTAFSFGFWWLLFVAVASDF